MHHIHPHGWRNSGHPQTKQSRKTLRRKERQARAYARFRADLAKFKGQDTPAWELVPMAFKQKIMEKYG